MRLLNYGPGEVWDRLTILARKMVEASPDVQYVGDSPYHKEFIELLSGLCKQSNTVLVLGAVNAAIWQREDDLRRFRIAGGNLDEAVATACEIQRLNDRRADLVQHLNDDDYQEKQNP